MSVESADWSWRIPVIVITFVTYLASWGIWLLAYLSNYPPFRARQLHVVAASLVACFFWQFGALYSFDVFYYEPPLDNCYLMKPIMYVLGAYRLLRLYYIAIKRVHANGILFWSHLFGPMIVAIAIAVAPLVIPTILDLQSIYDAAVGRRVCNYYSNLYMYLLFLVPVYITCFMIWVAFQLREIKKAFNEFRDLKVSLVACILLIFLQMALAMTGRGLLVIEPWRNVAKALTNTLASLLLTWSIMYSPLKGYLFNREQHLKDFQKSLKDEMMDKSIKKSNRSIRLLEIQKKSCDIIPK